MGLKNGILFFTFSSYLQIASLENKQSGIGCVRSEEVTCAPRICIFIVIAKVEKYSKNIVEDAIFSIIVLHSFVCVLGGQKIHLQCPPAMQINAKLAWL